MGGLDLASTRYFAGTGKHGCWYLVGIENLSAYLMAVWLYEGISLIIESMR